MPLLFSCSLTGNTKCCDPIATHAIAKGLYVERYRTFCAGVFGELTECYLTDSVSFREKIGTYDEHESFDAKLNGDSIRTYNFTASSISDTVERKTLSIAELSSNHHCDTNILAAKPLFGKNTIGCTVNHFPASSYKTNDGFYMSQVQYHCGNDFSNAVFFTDSLQFCIFVGVYVPGSLQHHYYVKQKDKESVDFYNVDLKDKIDTTKTSVYSLTQLKKGKLIKVCN